MKNELDDEPHKADLNHGSKLIMAIRRLYESPLPLIIVLFVVLVGLDKACRVTDEKDSLTFLHTVLGCDLVSSLLLHGH